MQAKISHSHKSYNMVMAYYSKICKELDTAANAGIITQEQALLLKKHFEDKKSFFSQLSVAHYLGIAGGIFIALGLILIIAFNWVMFGDFAKVAGYLFLLLAIGYGCIKSQNKPVLQKVLGAIWFFMPAIGIGLYAQIFQLSGSPLKPYLLWALLSSPLVFLFDSKLYSRLLSILLFVILYGTLEPNSEICLEISSLKLLPVAHQIAHWFYALLILTAANAVNFYKKDNFSPAIAASLVWVALLFANQTFFQIENEEFIASISLALTAIFFLWKLSKGHNLLNNGLRCWLFILYFISFLHSYTPNDDRYIAAPISLGIVTAILLMGTTIIVLLKTENKTSDNSLQTVIGDKFLSTIKIFIAISIFAPMLPLLFQSSNWLLTAAMANILLIASGIVLFMLGQAQNSKKLLNTAMTLIMLTAITRFFDLFGTQLTMGIAFILTGLLFAFLAWWFSRGLDKLITNKGIENK